MLLSYKQAHTLKHNGFYPVQIPLFYFDLLSLLILGVLAAPFF